MLVSVALMIVLALLTWRVRRTALPGRRTAAFRAGHARKVEAAVLAGLLATVEMGTVQVIVLAVFTELPRLCPSVSCARWSR
jgi:hypothetical protein